MTVTQRGELSERDARLLAIWMSDWAEAEKTQDQVRRWIAELVDRTSFRAVSEATGFSTNTLQRWKREAKS